MGYGASVPPFVRYGRMIKSTEAPGACIERIAVNTLLQYWKQVSLGLYRPATHAGPILPWNFLFAFNIVRFMTDCCDLIRSFGVLSLLKTGAATG